MSPLSRKIRDKLSLIFTRANKLRKTVFVDYRNYETLIAMSSDDALASAFVASALPGFRTRCRDQARKQLFCRSGQKWAESTGVFGPQMQHLSKCDVFAKIWIPPKDDFRTTNGFWAGYNAACPPERGGYGGRHPRVEQAATPRTERLLPPGVARHGCGSLGARLINRRKKSAPITAQNAF